MKPQFLSEEEAQEQFDLDQYGLLGDIPFESFIYLEGDVELNEDLTEETTEQLLFGEEAPEEESLLFIIKGNLKVNGELRIQEEMPCFLVLGEVHCEVLHSFDNVVHITGDAHIKYAFNGNYNHGAITIEGTTHVPYILNSDHDTSLTPAENTVVINYYSDQDDFFTYDYYRDDLSQVLAKKALNDENKLDYERFIDLLKAGKPPVKKGAKPNRVLVEQMITKLAKKSKDGAGIQHLDLKDKKLLTLPKAIFELDTLEELILEKNGFTSIPEELGNLKKLKRLNLRGTSITSLPSTLGQLENLEELNLNYCSHLATLPSNIGNLKNLKKLTLWGFQGEVPEEITQLSNLEELDIYGWYIHIKEPVDFPAWVFQLKSLKVLKASNNSFKNLPKGILGLDKLETLHLNSALCYVKELPDLSQLKNLKELEADGRPSINTRPPVKQTILQNYFKITSLERLKIDAFGMIDKWIPTSKIEQERERLKNDPEQLEDFEKRLRMNDSDNYFLEIRRAMQLEDFKGLENLVNLTYLDIEFNKLEKLPPEILQLKKLEHIKLNGNNIPESDFEKLRQLNPDIIIE
ncbi:MAG: leucine-rich repeat domain-containing protein [Thermonemataceae bacterium]